MSGIHIELLRELAAFLLTLPVEAQAEVLEVLRLVAAGETTAAALLAVTGEAELPARWLGNS